MIVNPKILLPLIILLLLLSTTVVSQRTSSELYNSILDNTRLNPEIAIEDTKKLLALSKEQKNYDSIAIAYMYLGKAGRIVGKYEQALEYVDLGIELAENNDVSKSILAELYLTKANNLADFGNAEESAIVMFKGIDIANQSDDLKTKVLLNHGLGYTYLASKKYNKARDILKENILLIEENKLIDKKSFETYYKGMAMLAKVYENKNEKDSTLLYLKEGLKHVLTTDDIFSTNAFYQGLSIIYLDRKEYEKAYKILEKSKILDWKIGNESTGHLNDYNLARYYYETNNYNKSISQLDSITNYYINNEGVINPEVYKLLAKSHKKLGNLEEANKYYELYVINFDNVRAEDEKLSNLIQDKELEDLKLDKQKEKRIASYYFIGGTILILLLLGCLLLITNKRKKEKMYFEALLSKIQNKNKETIAIIDTKDEILEETSSTDISDELTQEILLGLKKMEQQEYFLKQECNSYNVAKKIKTNTSYLSKVVNSHYQKNFNTYINDLRINYAVLRLKNDRQFRSYSIQSIANDIGYKSADSFTKYFKKHTGLNPSVFIKKINSLS